jgi:hypothetical protein
LLPNSSYSSGNKSNLVNHTKIVRVNMHTSSSVANLNNLRSSAVKDLNSDQNFKKYIDYVRNQQTLKENLKSLRAETNRNQSLVTEASDPNQSKLASSELMKAIHQVA